MIFSLFVVSSSSTSNISGGSSIITGSGMIKKLSTLVSS